MAIAAAVSERLEYLLLADEAPARCEGDLRDAVTQLQSKILEIGYLCSHGDEEQFNNPDLRTQFTDKFQSQIQRIKEMFPPEENEMFSRGENKISDGGKLLPVLGVTWRKQFMRLVYDIEDAVEIESYGQQEAAASKRKLGEICCLSNFSNTRKLKLDLDILTTRINSLEGDARRYLIKEGDSFSKQIDNRTRQSFPPDTRNLYHYRYPNIANLKYFLRHGYELSVLAIYGMGGIGKTTLANFLFIDRYLCDHFDCTAWAPASMKCSISWIAESLLSQIQHGFVNDNNMGMVDLMLRLHKSLDGRRYLIVLDGVWSTKVWHAISRCLPDNNNGSRIIITTRNRSVAERIGKYKHHVLPLNEKESWEFFKMISPMNDLPVMTSEVDDIRMQIVRHCRGLPLSIIISSSRLIQYKFQDWGKVLPSLKRDIDLELAEHTVGESYDELPFDLKQCFLNLGYFPPDHAITVEKLYLLWMAQGLISKKYIDNRTQIEVAEDYFNELVERSLILEVEEEEVSSSYKRFKSCKVHNLMRELCISKGKEEEFLEVIDHVDGNRERSFARHVAIYFDEFECFNDDLLVIPEAEHIRSIFFFGPKPSWPRSGLKHFRKTRILDFNGVHFEKLPSGIENLIYLRYLSFQECYLNKFPSSYINVFPLLETLDLRVRVSCEIIVSWNALRNFSSLRHLFLPLAFKTDTNGKLKLDTLKKLEILENFHAGICDAEDLVQLENVQVLTMIVDGDTMELENTIKAFSRFRFSIRHVSLEVKRFDSYSKKRLSVVKSLLQCNGVHSLEIEGHLGVLPCPGGIINSNFTRIVFNGSEFSEDPMPILGKLPNLISLVLCDDTFAGRKMVCSKEDFPQLVSLKIEALRHLEELEVETGTMPKLSSLTIGRCNKLKMFELTELLTLQKFMVVSMPEEFNNEMMMMADLMEDELGCTVDVRFYER